MGDEYIGRIDYDREQGLLHGIRIMRGQQNSQDPHIGMWSGTRGGQHLYRGIRSANTFLEYIDMVEDMEQKEITEWKAQVKFLKAYFHFILLQQYGPIVIADKAIPHDALDEEMFPKRSKVDDCFDYIIRLLDEAIPDLKERITGNDLGQIDQVIAASIKARVMLHRASPFFNGNKDYKDFLDVDGEPFFPQDEKREKWNEALTAIEDAIVLCSKFGIDELYTYEGAPITYDREDYFANENLRKLYDLRMLIVDPWNRELIWGRTYEPNDESTMASACAIRLPEMIDGVRTEGHRETNQYSWQWMSATYKMLERYYTKNGLPISEDRDFDMESRLTIVRTPRENDEAYAPLRGILQPGVQVVNMYLNREPRFYANLGITGGYWRAHEYKIPTLMFNTGIGGYSSAKSTDYLCTGVGIQKFVHPESRSGQGHLVIRTPYPVIRMADLYLMRAEVRNEIEGPVPAVLDDVNRVRIRAGIPTVQEAWGDRAKVLDDFYEKYKEKDKMREIILTERSIELAFEGGHRFWDMRRYRRATAEFSAPVMGWDYRGMDAETFFIVKLKHARRFLVRDYLWPLSLKDMDVNANLVQNPGW
jgi:hypothetical protein